MAKRPKARLITGHFDLRDVSFRTEIRSPKPKKQKRKGPPSGKASKRRGPSTRGRVLRSGLLWQRSRLEFVLRPSAQACLGRSIRLSHFAQAGEVRWMWTIQGTGCEGVADTLSAARVAVLEAALDRLDPARRAPALQQLAKLAGRSLA